MQFLNQKPSTIGFNFNFNQKYILCSFSTFSTPSPPPLYFLFLFFVYFPLSANLPSLALTVWVTDIRNCLGKLYFIAAAIKTNPQDVGLQSRIPFHTHPHTHLHSDTDTDTLKHILISQRTLGKHFCVPIATYFISIWREVNCHKQLSCLPATSLSKSCPLLPPEPTTPHYPFSLLVYYLFTIFSYSKWNRKPLGIIDGPRKKKTKKYYKKIK